MQQIAVVRNCKSKKRIVLVTLAVFSVAGLSADQPARRHDEAVFSLAPPATVHSVQQTTTNARQLELQRPPRDASVLELESAGDLLRSRKLYGFAFVYYRAALAKNPSCARLYNKIGLSEVQLSDFRDAKIDFEQALRIDPEYAEARNNLGVVDFLRGDYKEAIHHYKKALQLRKNSALLHANLATAYFARRQADKAMAAYARALELDPDVISRQPVEGVVRVFSPDVRAYHAYILAKTHAMLGDVDRSLECLRRAKNKGYSGIGDVYRDRAFLAVRSDPRFVELMRSR